MQFGSEALLSQHSFSWICSTLDRPLFKSLNKKQAIFFLIAPKSLHCCTAHLSDAVRTPHGNGQLIAANPSIKRMSASLLYHHADSGSAAGIEANGAAEVRF